MIRAFTLLTLGIFTLAGCANTPDPLAAFKTSASANKLAAIPKSKVETGVKLARIQESEGHLRKALEMYQRMHQTDPKNAEICHRLMVVHSRLDQPEQADAFFQKSDQLRPDNADLYADYGYTCYLRGELNVAETWLRKAHQIRSGEERITGNLALVLAAQGRDRESLTYYRQYLDEAEAQANVGYALTQRGDFAAARNRYAKALELDPKLKSAQHALLQLAEWEQAQKQANKNPTQKAQSQKPTGTASIRT